MPELTRRCTGKPIDQLFSAATICQLLDTKDRTFRWWVADSRFPAPDKRIGKALRWRESTVREFIESNGKG